ncbi:nonribosomal peptide synthetase [Colletotrichum karsti]|uniref:Nonribosomal peptide synthetase n=1 Tax=Colletotrichum karsti TaxID=1095194 RepID=A0A9P6HVS2_9PEZI|nr:nonribosomal peptide synthetase [Colletotrichum karsti]KAF9869771.1 nonribosomal peptide synthetase [Colletotrichum karsti]
MAPFVEDDVQHFLGSSPPYEVRGDKSLSKAALDPSESVENLSQLLLKAANTGSSLVFYSEEADELKPIVTSYKELLAEASSKARLISSCIKPDSPEQIVLLHFDTQKDNILWFWAATLAGYLPTLSLPLVNDTAQRRKHLLHLHALLKEPIILTNKRLAPEFLGLDQLNLSVVESLHQPQVDHVSEPVEESFVGEKIGSDTIAVLMLTSGSTGNVKAVPLRHGQILKAVRGKSMHHRTVTGDVFFNWIGLDHVASLTEIHLHAMSLGADQVHVSASHLLRDPLQFIRLLDTHSVGYTFAPNFFLTMVRDSLIANPDFTADLSSLKALISGGESNPTATCYELTRELIRLGCPGEVIRPGFGMTETCAGSIYSLSCPSYDLGRSVEFASLGSCIPGMRMRVMSISKPGEQAARGESGELQVSGPVVFDRYYNNEKATGESFTLDGWFITGDLCFLDDAGNLHLSGRTKDAIIVNGVKWSATELETAIEEEGITGIVPSFTVCFPTRAPGAPTESIAVVYSPAFSPEDPAARFETAKAIGKVVSLITGKKPARLVPLPQSKLEKSSLGKISRTKIRTALEGGELDSFEREDLRLLEEYRQRNWRSAKTETERIVQGTLAELLHMPIEEIDAETSIFDLGVDSMHLILLKSMIQKATGAAVDIPMSVMLTDPTVVAMASAIDRLMSQPTVYTPIVPLQPHGSGTPLFCIHPGSGDILVFIALAAHFPTRPVYALRSRGYNPDERFFRSIDETAETYVAHIREIQPEGPYAIAGYSLGSTLAFEVGKVLEAQGQRVKFLASIDYPPHIAHYVQSLDWIDVLLHIAFFLELIDEKTMVEITPHMHTLEPYQALSYILKIGDSERAKALAVDEDRLGLISDIAENFRVNVKTYEPLGNVECLDVFVADPPHYAARDRQDWRENKLGPWADFARTDAEFHDCPGIHAKMLNREHMADFAKIFKAAMRRRGI